MVGCMRARRPKRLAVASCFMIRDRKQSSEVYRDERGMAIQLERKHRSNTSAIYPARPQDTTLHWV